MKGTTQTLLGVSIPSGYINTVVGTGTNSYGGDGGPATSAKIRFILITNFDPSGNFYLFDYQSARLRKVTPSGTISTIAGNGTVGHTGDGGLASNAEVDGGASVKCDSAGNIYLATNESLRVINHSTGIITTILGNYALWSPGIGYVGDGGPAILAGIGPESIAFTGTQGAYYVTDILNNRVREVTPSTNAVYIAQKAAGGNTGEDCADPKAISYSNTSGNWSATPSGIGPDTIVHLCGTITTELMFQGSGAKINNFAGTGVQTPFNTGSSDNGNGSAAANAKFKPRYTGVPF